MDLQDMLRKEHSRANADRIMAWVGDSQQRFDQLVEIFTGQDTRLAQLSGWPLAYLVSRNPIFIIKHWRKLLDNLKQPGIHNAIIRSTIRMMQDTVIPQEYQGEVMTICFDLVTSPSQKPAIKAFALTVLHHLSSIYPEISEEIKLIIESQWPHESAAFRSRAKKILENLNDKRK